MEPAENLLIAAERVRLSLEASPVWAAALAGSVVRPPANPVFPLHGRGLPYYVVDIARGDTLTARFVLDSSGTLLEAEAIERAEGSLLPWVTPARPQGHDHAPTDGPRLVLQPSDQSTTRLRPFWEEPGKTGARYLRVDGVAFDRLTITGRG